MLTKRRIFDRLNLSRSVTRKAVIVPKRGRAPIIGDRILVERHWSTQVMFGAQYMQHAPAMSVYLPSLKTQSRRVHKRFDQSHKFQNKADK